MKKCYVVYDLQEGEYYPHFFSEDKRELIKWFSNHLRSVVGRTLKGTDIEVLKAMKFSIEEISHIRHKELLEIFYLVN